MVLKASPLFLIVIFLSNNVNGIALEPSASQLGWTEVSSESSSHFQSNSESSSSQTSDYHSYETQTTSTGSCLIQKSDLSSDDIEKLVKDHNFYRAKVANGEVKGQPSASNMNQIEWDDALAKLAQGWATKCTFEHNKPTNEKYSYIGQNLHQSSTTDCKDSMKNVSQATAMWFNEVKEPGYNVQYSPQDKGYPFVFSEGSGHYTQMVSANITHFGCGYVDYKTSSFCHTHYIVCNYGPGGNVEGEYIYKIGSPATNCISRQSSTTFPGLCSIK